MEWTVLIYAYYYAGKYNEAYECFIKANSKFSDKWEIYDIASYVCRALKRFDAAIKYSDLSYKLNSEYLDAVYSKAFCFEEMLKKSSRLRIDTHKDNLPMQRALAKFGFSYAGIIYIESGAERLAYEIEMK